jgi:dihydrofolate reductase
LFLEKNLIDEIFLTIEPVIIEGDLSIFKYVNDKYNFKLTDFKKLNEDTILLHYLKTDDKK